jgi:hypothetical protein
MPNLYELLIRGKSDGTIAGSHVVYFDESGRTGETHPIAPEDWPEVAQAVNAALSAEIASLQAQLAARPESEGVQTEASSGGVTPRQFRLALLSIGISPAAISAMLADDEAALTEWDYAQEIRRDHPLVESLRIALGKSEEEVDAVFVEAATL